MQDWRELRHSHVTAGVTSVGRQIGQQISAKSITPWAGLLRFRACKMADSFSSPIREEFERTFRRRDKRVPPDRVAKPRPAMLRSAGLSSITVRLSTQDVVVHLMYCQRCVVPREVCLLAGERSRSVPAHTRASGWRPFRPMTMTCYVENGSRTDIEVVPPLRPPLCTLGRRHDNS